MQRKAEEEAQRLAAEERELERLNEARAERKKSMRQVEKTIRSATTGGGSDI